jgi:uncharacterized protein YhdP
MAPPSQQTKTQEARKKATIAAATAAGSVAVAIAGAPAVGAIGIGVSAVLGYRWLRYRIENGLRF